MDGYGTNEDREHLKLLAIFHWIVAAIVALFALLPIIHLILGIGLVSGRFPIHERSDRDPFPIEAMGWFFIIFAASWMLASFTMAFCLALSARSLGRQRRRTFCMVVAAIACLFFPFGTALGVFTLIVLSRPSVRAMFDPSAPPLTSSH